MGVHGVHRGFHRKPYVGGGTPTGGPCSWPGHRTLAPPAVKAIWMNLRVARRHCTFVQYRCVFFVLQRQNSNSSWRKGTHTTRPFMSLAHTSLRPLAGYRTLGGRGRRLQGDGGSVFFLQCHQQCHSMPSASWGTRPAKMQPCLQTWTGTVFPLRSVAIPEQGSEAWSDMGGGSSDGWCVERTKFFDDKD